VGTSDPNQKKGEGKKGFDCGKLFVGSKKRNKTEKRKENGKNTTQTNEILLRIEKPPGTRDPARKSLRDHI